MMNHSGHWMSGWGGGGSGGWMGGGMWIGGLIALVVVGLLAVVISRRSRR
jgi:hypothetical protein